MNDKMNKKNSQPLSLRVPEPSGRPGDTPDFSHLQMDPAGVVERPEVGSTPYQMRDLAFRLIRVLDDEGAAVGPWNPRLDPETMRRGLKAMILTRAFDDRMHRAHRQGKTSFYMKCTGEEAIAVAQGMILSREDMGFPTYRQQGLLIARGYPLVAMMNQIYSNAEDPIKGRQLPIMYSAKDYGFFTISGNLGTQVPQAVGWAMASAYKVAVAGRILSLVDAGSLTAAGQRLEMSTTMVGNHLRALEQRLGLPLLNRTTRRQSPTEAGANSRGGAASTGGRTAEAHQSRARAQSGAPAPSPSARAAACWRRAARQLRGQRGELRGQLGVVGLCSQLLGPVEGQEEVGAAVVDLADLAAGRIGADKMRELCFQPLVFLDQIIEVRV